jgi:hypothetical protein
MDKLFPFSRTPRQPGMGLDLFRGVLIFSAPKSDSRTTDKPIHLLGTKPTIRIGTFRSQIYVMVHSLWRGRLGLDVEQAREIFSPIKSSRSELARVFDDLPDLETERQCRVVRS